MADALHRLMVSAPYSVTLVDVDADPVLLARYDELVPVLTAQRAGGVEMTLCHYVLDTVRVQQFVTESQLTSAKLPFEGEGASH